MRTVQDHTIHDTYAIDMDMNLRWKTLVMMKRDNNSTSRQFSHLVMFLLSFRFRFIFFWAQIQHN